MTNSKPFQTIKEACISTGLSQYFLREGCKSGSVPHIKSGMKYYINIPLLLEKLATGPSEANNSEQSGKEKAFPSAPTPGKAKGTTLEVVQINQVDYITENSEIASSFQKSQVKNPRKRREEKATPAPVSPLEGQIGFGEEW